MSRVIDEHALADGADCHRQRHDEPRPRPMECPAQHHAALARHLHLVPCSGSASASLLSSATSAGRSAAIMACAVLSVSPAVRSARSTPARF